MVVAVALNNAPDLTAMFAVVASNVATTMEDIKFNDRVDQILLYFEMTNLLLVFSCSNATICRLQRNCCS